MASTERIFFAAVATTVLLIGAGFGGGVMLGETASRTSASSAE